MSIVRMWRWSNQPLLPISTIPLYRPISPPLAIQLPRYLLSLSRPRHHYLPLPLNASTHISRTSISPPTRHPISYIHYSYYRIVSLPFNTLLLSLSRSPSFSSSQYILIFPHKSPTSPQMILIQLSIIFFFKISHYGSVISFRCILYCVNTLYGV